MALRGLLIKNNPLLTSIDLSTISRSGSGFVISGNASLASFSLPDNIYFNNLHPALIDLTGNAFTAATVNALLALAVLDTEFVSGTLDMSGGTNAAPTGQGITDKATLIARGVTVITN